MELGGSIHEMNFGVYHEARQLSQLFSPGRFRCFLVKGCSSSVGPPMLKPKFVYTTNAMFDCELKLNIVQILREDQAVVIIKEKAQVGIDQCITF